MVRRAAAQAAGLTCWAGFVHDLESLLKGEPVETVSRAAEYAVHACQRLSQASQVMRTV